MGRRDGVGREMKRLLLIITKSKAPPQTNKSKIRKNSKLEYRNPKQILMTKILNTQAKSSIVTFGLFWVLEILI